MRTTDQHDFSGGQKATIVFLEGLGLVVDAEKKIGTYQVDIYLPELNAVVEFDGPHMHHSVKARTNRDATLLCSGISKIYHINGTNKEELETLRRWLQDAT